MEKYIQVAYKEALKAYKKNEIPVGAVIVKNNKIIAKSHNNRQKKHTILGHAEINVILKAEKKLKDWRLDDCEMYVTLEPCEMCEKIINESRIKKVYYLLNSERNKHIFVQINDCNDLKSAYQNILQNFFKKMRSLN